MPSALSLGFSSLHTGMGLCFLSALLGRTSLIPLSLGPTFCPPPIHAFLKFSPPTPSCLWSWGGGGGGEVQATEINFLPINFQHRKVYHYLLSPFCRVDIESKNLPSGQAEGCHRPPPLEPLSLLPSPDLKFSTCVGQFPRPNLSFLTWTGYLTHIFSHIKKVP